MGVELVGIVSAKYGHLPAGPFKLLVRMAVVALDRPNKIGQPARVYYKGWEDLALALGRDVPPMLALVENAPEIARIRNNVKSEVMRHTRTLVNEGAVQKAVDNPRTRHRQVWVLTLGEGVRIVLPDEYELPTQ